MNSRPSSMSINLAIEPPACSPKVESTGSSGVSPALISPAGGAETAALRPITLLQPGRILFGNGCVTDFVAHLVQLRLRNLFVVTSASVASACGDVFAQIEAAGIHIRIYPDINTEPTVRMFEDCLAAARRETIDGVIGFGGGSPMDVAKLVATLADSTQTVADVFGINQLHGRGLFLACLPTTAGTGSEVSPNSILLDESCQLKKGIISPHLVPDVACVDPLLTCSLPPTVTAATGLDALTHCIEAYANCFAHPTVDLYALQGIRLIAKHLLAAVANGRDTEARANLALGSLYGGLCLGPVNTAAVHALAYPLGSEFHIAHGISNAVLLPHVLRFNLPCATERYADIAVALGVPAGPSAQATAERGIGRIVELMAQCPMQRRISEMGVPQEALPLLAKAAMTVTRLLKNNPRVVTEADALQIYQAAW